MPKTSLIVSFIGDDRPGLVEEFSGKIAPHNANWIESRMTQLAGKFAGLFRIEADAGKMLELKQAIEELTSDKMHIMMEEISDKEKDKAEQGPVHYHKLEILGHDRVGIVREISRTLLEENINISDFISEVTTAPMSGNPLFKASVTFENMGDHGKEVLQSKLDKIATKLSIEINLV